MAERSTMTLGIRSKRLSTFREGAKTVIMAMKIHSDPTTVASNSPSLFVGSENEELTPAKFGKSSNGYVGLHERRRQISKSSDTVVHLVGNYNPSSRFENIPDGIQVTPAPRETRRSNKAKEFSSSKSKIYYHRKDGRMPGRHTNNHSTIPDRQSERSQQITIPVPANGSSPQHDDHRDEDSGKVDMPDAPVTYELKTGPNCKKNDCPTVFHLNKINLNQELVSITPTNNGKLSLNQSLSRKFVTSRIPHRSCSSFYPESRNQPVPVIEYLPLREVYLKATVMDGINTHEIAEDNKISRIREWLKSLSYFDNDQQMC